MQFFNIILLLLVTLVVMEVAVTLIHRHLMHGIGWAWHKSHHQPGNPRRWEANDWYAVMFSALTVLLFALGGRHDALWWIAAGVSLYGLLYGLLHDVVVHRRLGPAWQPGGGFLRRLVTAHRLHHAVRTREGGVSFGFLYAPPVDAVRSQLRAQRKRG